MLIDCNVKCSDVIMCYVMTLNGSIKTEGKKKVLTLYFL